MQFTHIIAAVVLVACSVAALPRRECLSYASHFKSSPDGPLLSKEQKIELEEKLVGKDLNLVCCTEDSAKTCNLDLDTMEETMLPEIFRLPHHQYIAQPAVIVEDRLNINLGRKDTIVAVWWG